MLFRSQRKRERRVVRLFEGEQACTVAALRFPALFGPPIAPLPRKRFASSAAGGASPLSPRPPLPPRRKKLRFIRFRLRRNRTALRFFLLSPQKPCFCGDPTASLVCAPPARGSKYFRQAYVLPKMIQFFDWPRANQLEKTKVFSQPFFRIGTETGQIRQRGV